jgi:hypothetical protein
MGLPPGFGDCQPGDVNTCIPNPPPIGPPSTPGFGISVAFVLSLITGIATSIYNLIAKLVAALKGAFGALHKFLLHVWQCYVKKAITGLFRHVKSLREWLKRTIPPIIKRLEKIKKWYDTHVLKQQLRMLQQIQMVRRFLGILRIFHVKWAAKIDSTLADLQNRIEQSISIVRGTLNQIVNTLALVLDPALLITRDVLAGSLLKNLAAVKRIFSYSQHGPLTASETTFLDHNVGRYNKSTGSNHIAALASTGLTTYDQSERTDSRKGISDAIAAALPF